MQAIDTRQRILFQHEGKARLRVFEWPLRSVSIYGVSSTISTVKASCAEFCGGLFGRGSIDSGWGDNSGSLDSALNCGSATNWRSTWGISSRSSPSRVRKSGVGSSSFEVSVLYLAIACGAMALCFLRLSLAQGIQEYTWLLVVPFDWLVSGGMAVSSMG